ncbi:hypothetical protein KEJ45_01155 [Candidatus Bathyarchaeota archaeon]|nr:hypothetical protein [Candidatus Bathyarchaeota archaeon]
MFAKGRKPEWWRRFWIEMAIGFVILSAVNCMLYFLGYINFYALLRNTITIFLIIGFCYMLQHIRTEVLSEKGRLTLNKIAYVLLGACLGIVVSLFCIGLTTKALGLESLPNLIGTWPAIIFNLIIAPTIGGFIGYLIGKRKNFHPPFKNH